MYASPYHLAHAFLHPVSNHLACPLASSLHLCLKPVQRLGVLYAAHILAYSITVLILSHMSLHVARLV